MKRKIFLCALVFLNSEYTFAEDLYNKPELSVGFSLLKMQYKEFDDTGFLLDREDGLLPGISGQFTLPGNKINHSFYASYHSSTIDYDGHTQNLIPVPTDTETDIVDIHYRINQKEQEKNSWYGGLGYRYWRRNILPTIINYEGSLVGVAGILEHYKWFYGFLGFKSRITKDYNSVWFVDLRVTRMLKANMDIDFLGYADLDDKTVNLGKKTNFRIGLPWRISNSKSHTWIIEPYFEQWDIGKSNTVNLTSNGSPVILPECNGVCGVLEPRSETRNIGINFQVVVPF